MVLPPTGDWGFELEICNWTFEIGNLKFAKLEAGNWKLEIRSSELHKARFFASLRMTGLRKSKVGIAQSEILRFAQNDRRSRAESRNCTKRDSSLRSE